METATCAYYHLNPGTTRAASHRCLGTTSANGSGSSFRATFQEERGQGFQILSLEFCADVGPPLVPGDARILVFRTQVASQKVPGPGPLGPGIPAVLICAHVEHAYSYNVTDRKEDLGSTFVWWFLHGCDSVRTRMSVNTALYGACCL